MIDYTPFMERVPDSQYRRLLERILRRGRDVMPQQGEAARQVVGHELRFDLKNGFPIITERDLLSPGQKSPPQYLSAIAELCAFLNGAQTLDEMKEFGCLWWSRWVTPEKCAKRGLPSGDLGPGSYGAAWRRFPTAEGEPFDQITTLIEQIKELPHLRTLRVTNWIPQYIPRGKGRTQKVVVAPCHGDFQVMIDAETREMDLVMVQRSGDVPVGVVFNLIQYASLLMMLAQVTGYVPREYVHYIVDAHIYYSQLADVEKLLGTEPKRLPTVTLDPTVKDIFAFRPEHFSVSDYWPSLGRMTIPTPV